MVFPTIDLPVNTLMVKETHLRKIVPLTRCVIIGLMDFFDKTAPQRQVWNRATPAPGEAPRGVSARPGCGTCRPCSGRRQKAPSLNVVLVAGQPSKSLFSKML